MLLYASSIIENIAAGLCMSLVLYDQSSSAINAHTPKIDPKIPAKAGMNADAMIPATPAIKSTQNTNFDILT